MKRFLPGVFCIIIIMTPMLATGQQTDSLDYRKFRVTLFPGLSSNGINAPDYNARYSLNIIAGYHGGLDGFEIGPVNINRKFSRGVQLGVVNGTGGEMAGLHFAGVVNTALGEMQGIQASGVVNTSIGDMQGVQISGITNVTNGGMQGIQFAGIANVAAEGIQGIQFSGVANTANGDLQGLLFSGVTNVTMGDAQGLLFAGAVNYSREFQGIASSGVLNIANRMEGIQIAGLANIANRAEGVQIGLINYARHFEGMPIGLISYYENGRKNIDLWITETGFSHVGLKLGTHQVYNMLSFGYNPFITSRDVWSVGWSIGSYKTLDDAWNNPKLSRYFSHADFSIQKIQDNRWSHTLNNLYSYRYMLGKDFSNAFSVYAGPTLNLLVTRQEGYEVYVPYTIFEGTRKGRDYSFWIGFTAGLQLSGH